MAETLTQGDTLATFAAKDSPECLALVILASVDEPWRAGEVAGLSAGRRGDDYVLGRGEGDRSGSRRVAFVRQRPGHQLATPALADGRISRRQLRLRVQSDRLEVENLGRARLYYNGEPVEQATLRPGDCIEIGSRLSLLLTERPIALAELHAYRLGDAPAFGRADALGIVGESPTCWATREQAAFAAERERHVLVHGQSGTGKELICSAIHALSRRGAKRLVARNAATIPSTLIDAELFGNRRDYPNPGTPEREGLIGAADGSTLFLDEIGELPESLQTHLLRVLDSSGEYQRLGEDRIRHSNFRLVGATNRPLEALRGDVLARFPLRMTLPGLNERREDVPLLAAHLMRRLAAEDPKLRDRFFEPSPLDGQLEARFELRLLTCLASHTYTHHARELENLLWISLSSSPGSRLRLTPEVDEALVPHEASERDVEELTPEQIQACLDRNDGVQARVWRELGLKNRHQLRRLIKKYDLKVESGEES